VSIKHKPVAEPAPEERCPTSTPNEVILVALGFAVPDTVAGNWSGELVRAALLTTLL